MSQKLDITKPVKEIIVDKFNARSGFQLDHRFVELGTITPLPQPNDLEDTEIELVPTVLAPFLNTFHLKYKRMDLSDIFGAPNLFVPSGVADTLYELLIDLNLVVGLNLTTDDVEDDLVDDTDPADKKITIKTKATSVFYKGEVTLHLDRTLNSPPGTETSNTTIYLVNEVPAGMDYLSGHAFDGYSSNSFKFLRNVDLVTQCKIVKVFTCESNLLVLSGTFQLVATKLPFINPAVTYKTLTLDRTGAIISARQEITPLILVEPRYVSMDPELRCYYICDPDNIVNQTTKKVYRLFQNGTIDSNFNTSNLPDNTIRIIPCKTGFYTVSVTGMVYSINRYDAEGVEDAGFTRVSVKSNNGPYLSLSGYSTVDEFNKEKLELFLFNGSCAASSAPEITSDELNHVKSTRGSDFYSPVITIAEDGKRVDASGDTAKWCGREVLEEREFNPVLTKNIKGGSAIYSMFSFDVLNYQTVTPLLFDLDQAYHPELVKAVDAQNVTALSKVLQISSGHETYCIVSFTDRVSGAVCSAVLSFGPDHTLNGVIVLRQGTATLITDIAVTRR